MANLYPRAIKAFTLLAFALSSAISLSAQCPGTSTPLGNGNNQTISSGIVCLTGSFTKKVTIQSGAELYIRSGGSFTGTLILPAGGTVYVEPGATFTPNGSSVLNGTITYGSPLPIVLQSFTANASGNAVQLHWATVSELNGKSMIVQHSTDGVNFDDIKDVPSITNSSLVQNYSYVDYNAANGINYYRLKLVSSDAPASYSPVAAVTFNNTTSGSVAVFPSAFTDQFTVKLNEVKSGNVIVKLYNGQGALILVKSLSGSATQIINTPSNLSRGLYILEVDNGSDKSFHRLMKL
jgi:autotransporter passenger strand-loop-strand repeat protein